MADINTVCESVESDWSGAHRVQQQQQQQVSSPTGAESPAVPLKDQVHQALGQLIKQRRVYYTGTLD